MSQNPVEQPRVAAQALASVGRCGSHHHQFRHIHHVLETESGLTARVGEVSVWRDCGPPNLSRTRVLSDVASGVRTVHVP